MRHVNLWRHDLHEVPESVWLDSDVETLNLAENQIRWLPDRFATFTRLRILDLGHNKLDNIPDSSANWFG
jgi:Leucine-rich repeat (LRR) protein